LVERGKRNAEENKNKVREEEKEGYSVKVGSRKLRNDKTE
jgi:hypothetical protein